MTPHSWPGLAGVALLVGGAIAAATACGNDDASAPANAGAETDARADGPATEACRASGGYCVPSFCGPNAHGGQGCGTGICCLPGAIENRCLKQGGSCVISSATGCKPGSHSMPAPTGCSDPVQEGIAMMCCLLDPADAGADADADAS